MKKKIKEKPTREVEHDKEIRSNQNKNNVDKIEEANVENIPINDKVANEVAGLVQNLQDEVESKERRIKFVESEKHRLQNKVKTLTIDLKNTKRSHKQS